MFCSLVLIATWLVICVHSYVPASPTNSTRDAIEGGLNVSDTSQLLLQWYLNGSSMHTISYELVGENSQGISKGALVHFSEMQTNSNTPPSSTRFIALISCDFNATDANQEIDIFTLARDKGAVGALLYSLYSTACIINPEYADPLTFDQVFDIFSTQTLTVSHMIEYQFGQIGSSNESYSWYDSQRLNDSGAAVNATIESNSPVQPGYLFATLRAHNASGDSNYTDTSGNNGGNNGGQTGGSNTGLAMIILYAITGCVSALFCVVIVSGAIRAIRHPERYGPRRNGFGRGGAPQSRATGLGRAILDTFPIVKFGGTSTPVDSSGPDRDKDLEADSHGASPDNKITELRSLGIKQVGVEGDISATVKIDTVGPASSSSLEGAVGGAGSLPSHRPPSVASNLPSTSRALSSLRDKSDTLEISQSQQAVTPAAIGRETCPICIVDFEEGDDLRQLPCEGRHRFHQECVDPWLLELSSSCPICRQDFMALESMLSRDTSENAPALSISTSPPVHQENGGGRFSRYIRSAVHRHRHRRHYDDSGTDQTDPPAPRAATTSP